MKQLFFCMMAVILSVPDAPAQRSAFSGRFSAVNPQNNATMILNLRNENDRITGKYSEPANPDVAYGITGVVKDGILKGRMVDMVNGIWQFRFTATLEGSGFRFKLNSKFWASLIPEMVFKPSLNTETGVGAAAGFDPRLAGNWYYIDNYSSSNYDQGTFSYTSEEKMSISGDGYMTTSSGQSFTDNGGVYSSSSGGGGSTVKIFTQGKELYITTAEGQVLLGRYVVDDNRLMIIDSKGNKKMWKRE